jgi:CheY-like chemotaxis protein
MLPRAPLGYSPHFRPLPARLTSAYLMAHRDQTPVLLAEDNENDVLMFRRASRNAKFTNPVYVVNDGEEVIAYLKGEGKYADRRRHPLPRLLLLDIKMPRKNGFDVLEWVRTQPQFVDLEIVVLSSSDEIRDINRAYELGANSFLVKPMFFSEFVGMLEALHSYCLRVWQQRDRMAARAVVPPPTEPAAVGI